MIIKQNQKVQSLLKYDPVTILFEIVPLTNEEWELCKNR